MRRASAVLVAAALTLMSTPVQVAHAQSTGGSPTVPPLVCGAWLDTHRTMPGLVVVDTRTAAEYATGHLAGAVSIPFQTPVSAWSAARNNLTLELPATTDLFATLGNAGITPRSTVVVVSSVAQPPYPLAGATRVALTLRYAGVRTIAILNGGYPKWVAEGRPTTTEVPQVTPQEYHATVDDRPFVGIEDVHRAIGRTLIVDARNADVYSGAVTESWAQKPGHIPSAVSLPAVSMWNEDGTYKSPADLDALVRTATGDAPRNQEIILYCGVGGYASSWLYVMTRMLGYSNVRFYDGSAQEWVTQYDMAM